MTRTTCECTGQVGVHPAEPKRRCGSDVKGSVDRLRRAVDLAVASNPALSSMALARRWRANAIKGRSMRIVEAKVVRCGHRSRGLRTRSVLAIRAAYRDDC